MVSLVRSRRIPNIALEASFGNYYELKCNANLEGTNRTFSQSMEALNMEERPRTTKSRERKRILKLMTAHAFDADANTDNLTELYRPRYLPRVQPLVLTQALANRMHGEGSGIYS